MFILSAKGLFLLHCPEYKLEKIRTFKCIQHLKGLVVLKEEERNGLVWVVDGEGGEGKNARTVFQALKAREKLEKLPQSKRERRLFLMLNAKVECW